MSELPYISGYPEHLVAQVRDLIAQDKLGACLLYTSDAADDLTTV